MGWSQGWRFFQSNPEFLNPGPSGHPSRGTSLTPWACWPAGEASTAPAAAVEHRASEPQMAATLGRAFPPRSPTRLSTAHGPASVLQPSRDAHAQPLAEPPTRAYRPPAPTARHQEAIPSPKDGLRRSWRRLGLDAVAGEEPVETDTWTARSVAPLKMQLAGWSACCTKMEIPGGASRSPSLSFPFLSFPFITSVLSNLLSMVLSSMLSRPLGLAR